jgi:hypothetical protein
MVAAIYKNPGDIVKGDGAGIFSQHCPICGQPINEQAASEFMTPPDWLFWGKPGQRAKVCEGFLIDIYFVHFAVQLPSGAVRHRIAWEFNEEDK